MENGNDKKFIRHVIVPVTSTDLFATALFEHTVSVWSYKEKKKLSEFETVLDFGGNRLLLLPVVKPLVIAGAYNRRGIYAYDALTGKIIWDRSDLKRVQDINAICAGRNGIVIGVGFDSKPYHLLDATSGDTVAKLRGIREMYSRDNNISLIACKRHEIKFIDNEQYTVKWTKMLESFAILDVAFCENQILISQAGGPLQCYDDKGQMLWELNHNKYVHALYTSWFPSENYWLAFTWEYYEGTAAELIAIDKQGKKIWSKALDKCTTCAFFNNGRNLITANGLIIDVLTLDTVWQFYNIKW